MILVTGASGHLASRVLDQLLDQGVPAAGASRSPSEGERRLDFDYPDSIDLRGISTLLLVSAGYAEDDVVVARHERVIEAAVRDGVGHVVYTSLAGAGDHLAFALAHRVTERMIRASGLPWTILRNGLYAELVGSLLTWDDDHLSSAFGDGAVAAVARDDLAAVAATVAADPAQHRGRTYELVGAPFTAADVAARLGVEHRSVSLSTDRQRLLAAPGLFPFQPPMLSSIASSIRHGLLDGRHPDLESLLGRPTTDPVGAAATSAPVPAAPATTKA
ncbi:NAD(P)H-binding protein [Aeromicrobium endophyticum]|uniref:NmrA family transcriptional regulator n=1 Tax=Aeromicrobium endophyticum TaxID=2292704 RepID=A0A371PCE7_9ACTN|nr:NAD(P)H-binding protein [Aeromicrobium endophyticum]REK73583.1 NmrA family transcriptional regulator [Aeromicrobium endophyticum]